MAITKILNIGAASEGIRSAHLKNALNYIVNGDKTHDNAWVGSVNCLPVANAAYEQMLQTKQQFGKELGRQGYHIIISFDKGECSPDIAFKIGKEFAETCVGEEYESVYAVHDDREHCHIHIIFNSVSMYDGKKYHYNKGDWKYIIQPTTNRLCRKYNLSTIPAEYSREKSNISRKDWNSDKSYERYIIDNARYCLSIAEDERHFIWLMRKLGYSVKEGVHLAVWVPGMKRYKRLDTIDRAFARENIEESIRKAHTEDIRMEEVTVDPVIYYHGGIYGYQENYYGWLVRMRKVEMNRFNYKMARFYKNCMLVEKMQQKYSFLVDNNIHCWQDILLKKYDIRDKLEEISDQQKAVYKENALARRRCKSPEDITEYQRIHVKNEKRLEELKERKNQLNNELRIAEEIDEEYGLSVIEDYLKEVVLENGWQYGDYSTVPDKPEPPEYPYSRKNIREVIDESIDNGMENSVSDDIEIENEDKTSDIIEYEMSEMVATNKGGFNLLDTEDGMEHGIDNIRNIPEKNLIVNTENKTEIEQEKIAVTGKKEKEDNSLPDNYYDFLRLTYEEKARRLFKCKEDAENTLYLLQAYAGSIGYNFSDFDELLGEAEKIQSAYTAGYTRNRAEEIVSRLRLMGVTGKEFVKTDSGRLAQAFAGGGSDLREMSKVYSEVIRLLGVKGEQEEITEKFMEIYRRCMEIGDRGKKDNMFFNRGGRVQI